MAILSKFKSAFMFLFSKIQRTWYIRSHKLKVDPSAKKPKEKYVGSVIVWRKIINLLKSTLLTCHQQHMKHMFNKKRNNTKVLQEAPSTI